MKIGVYSFHSFPEPIFGQNIRMTKIIKHLSTSNEVTVYAPTSVEDETFPLRHELEKNPSIRLRNISFPLTYRYGLINDLRVYRLLKKEYERGNFEILQLENSIGAYFTMKKSKFPKVIVFHGRCLEELSYMIKNRLRQYKIKDYLTHSLLKFYFSLCERAFALESNAILATSELVKQYAVQFGANPSNITISKNGIDLADYEGYRASRQELRRKLGIPEDAIVFVFHGSLKFEQNIVAIKNIIKIERRLNEYNQLKKDCFFIIVGGPKSMLEKYSIDATMVNNIRFTGYVDDVRPYLFAADCGIAPFPEDVMPGGPRLKILEFLAARLPVVTTKTGISGLEELLEEQPIYLLEDNFRDLGKLSLFPQCEVNMRKLERFDWKRIAAHNEQILKRTLESYS